MKQPDYPDLPYEILAVKEGVVMDVARSIVGSPGFKAVLTYNGETLRESEGHADGR
jgi:hypothetical protein